jgi:hypothetical protein
MAPMKKYIVPLIVLFSLAGVFGLAARTLAAPATRLSFLSRSITVIFPHQMSPMPRLFATTESPHDEKLSIITEPSDDRFPPPMPKPQEPMRVFTSKETASRNGVSLSMNSVSLFDSYLEADACVQLPDNADWLPEASMIVNGQQLAAAGWSLQDARNPETYTNDRRCYSFVFPFAAEAKTNTERVEFSLDRISTSIPEVIDAEKCNAARQQLLDLDTGIELSCGVSSDGIPYFEVSRSPEHLGESEVSSMIVRALTRSVQGPWSVLLSAQ